MEHSVVLKVDSLSKRQKQYLSNRLELLQLTADLAHAQADIYIPDKKKEFFLLGAQALPHTTFLPGRSNRSGAILPIMEEPLVARTWETGQMIDGQREWSIGHVAHMRTYPLYDDEENLIAVLSLEASRNESSGNGLLMQAAYDFFAYLIIKEMERPIYRPLSARDGILLIDGQGWVVYANAAAHSIYNVLGTGRVEGRRIHDPGLYLQAALLTTSEKKACEKEWHHRPMTIMERSFYLPPGISDFSSLIILSDVTEQKQKQKELMAKAVVIQEIHHRVKNNLQTIASLLRLQARRSTSEAVKEALGESVNRIVSIALVHELLSQEDRGLIDLTQIGRKILDILVNNLLEPSFQLQTEFKGDELLISSEKAASLALVFNELVQNSLEHAFEGRAKGRISVHMVREKIADRIEISDNGCGVECVQGKTLQGNLGLQIVRTLVEESLGGTLEFQSSQGLKVRIFIPHEMKEDGHD